MCSKHVEAWNKLIVKQKFCASSWLITEIMPWTCYMTKSLRCWDSVAVQQIAATVPISLLRAKESRRAKSRAITSVVTCVKSKHLCLDSDALVQLIEIYCTCWAMKPQFLYDTQLAERTGKISPIQWGSNIMLLAPHSFLFFNTIPTKLVSNVLYRMYLDCLGDPYDIFAQLVKQTHILSYSQPKPLHLIFLFS